MAYLWLMNTPTPHPINAYLALHRISKAELARAIGRSQAYTGRVCNGWVRPSKGFMRAVSDVLGVPVEELFDTTRIEEPVHRHPGDERLRGRRHGTAA